MGLEFYGSRVLGFRVLGFMVEGDSLGSRRGFQGPAGNLIAAQK